MSDLRQDVEAEYEAELEQLRAERDEARADATRLATLCAQSFPHAQMERLDRELSEARAQLKVQYRILDELEGSFDEQTYSEKAREDYDAPDDREYSVNITAKQLRAISTALATIKVDS